MPSQAVRVSLSPVLFRLKCVFTCFNCFYFMLLLFLALTWISSCLLLDTTQAANQDRNQHSRELLFQLSSASPPSMSYVTLPDFIRRDSDKRKQSLIQIPLLFMIIDVQGGRAPRKHPIPERLRRTLCLGLHRDLVDRPRPAQ